MVRCGSCEATLDVTDRFCPACGTPNAHTKFHPKFGPEPEGPPEAPPKHTAPPKDQPYCPRCWSVVALSDPWCSQCGMSLDEVRAEAELAAFLETWSDPSATGVRMRRAGGKLGVLTRLSLAATAGLAAAISVATFLSVVRDQQLFLPIRFDGTTTSTWEGRAQIAMFVLALFTAVVFVCWSTRAYRNLPALGVRGMRFSPFVAALVWFVPFVDLVLPKEVLDDLWRASDPDVPPLSPVWRLRAVPARLNLGWISVLAAIVLLAVAQWVLPAPGGPESAASEIGSLLASVAHAVAAFAAVLALVFVNDIRDRQLARIDRLTLTRPFERLDASLLAEDDEAEGETFEPLTKREDGSVVWGRY